MTPALVTERDLARLAHIHAQSFATPWTEDSLKDLLKIPGTFAYQFEAGFIVARVAGDEAEILTLAVRPEQRRSGRATRLVRAAAEHAHRLGANCLFLEVAPSNVAARGLYGGLGFAEVGRRKGYYAASQGEFEDALILRSNLPVSPLGNRPSTG